MEPFHANWFGQYKYDSTFETDDNYLIQFKIQIIAQLLDSK